MANFTNNTTQLQNLLEKVNALPEAGSEGGGEISRELLYATGTLQLTLTHIYSPEQTFFTVSGLSFKPKHVIVCYNKAGGAGYSSATQDHLIYCQGGCVSDSGGVSGNQYSKDFIYIRKDKARIDITDDGFSVVATSAVKVLNVPYLYIAFG